MHFSDPAGIGENHIQAGANFAVALGEEGFVKLHIILQRFLEKQQDNKNKGQEKDPVGYKKFPAQR